MALEVAHPVPVDVASITHIVQHAFAKHHNIVRNQSRARGLVVLGVVAFDDAFDVEMVLEFFVDHDDVVLAFVALVEDVAGHPQNPLAAIDGFMVRGHYA